MELGRGAVRAGEKAVGVTKGRSETLKESSSVPGEVVMWGTILEAAT